MYQFDLWKFMFDSWEFVFVKMILICVGIVSTYYLLSFNCCKNNRKRRKKVHFETKKITASPN